MLIGIYGIILEFFNPGAVAPGLIGTISLLVALYALAFIPINYAGVALVIVGIGLMMAEVHIGAFGALGVGGVAAFVIGALHDVSCARLGLHAVWGVVIGAALGSAALILLALATLLRSRKRPVVTGGEALIGAEGEAVSWEARGARARARRNLAGPGRQAARRRSTGEGAQPRRADSLRRSRAARVKSVSRALRSMKWCAADPGSLRTPCL